MPPKSRIGNIKPRKPNLGFTNDLPVDWYSGNPVIPRLCNVISLMFPAGEQFFIDSVKHYQSQIQDPKLLEDIVGFIGQEAQHSKQHAGYNKILKNRDTNLKKFEKIPAFILGMLKKLPARSQLAVTCSLEHFTTLFAYHMLSSSVFKNHAHPVYAKLWIWHAVEELEHKAVCFDVYRTVAGGFWGYVERCFWMLSTSLVFFTMIATGFLMSSAPKRKDSKQKPLEQRRFGRGIWRVFFRKENLVREIMPPYFAYYLPWFHPNNLDSFHLIERWKTEYKGELFTADYANHH